MVEGEPQKGQDAACCVVGEVAYIHGGDVREDFSNELWELHMDRRRWVGGRR